MKKLALFIPVILLLIVSSCDSRKSKIDRLKNSVSEFNNNQKSIDLIDYYPKDYTEIKTDSIISNTFKVSVKNFTLKDQGIVLNQSIKNLNRTSKVHRVFVSNIVVSVEEKIIYDRQISVEKIRDLKSSEFWNNATLEHVWVNQEQSNSEYLSLGVSVINPTNKAFRLYELLIDRLGNERLLLIEDHS
ncbi:hypothetical protein [Psychroserpens sp. Hel_I_66]|uniref:hypothetical protein n=1 Tax=Psychroserpens sp. Hel_I_66 TaxID=1250004 RepID=UPI000647A28C|nr:hypothetical protein [Psychroserpens sp. Hel_I_66]